MSTGVGSKCGDFRVRNDLHPQIMQFLLGQKGLIAGILGQLTGENKDAGTKDQFEAGPLQLKSGENITKS